MITDLPDTMFRDPEQKRLSALRARVLVERGVTEIEMKVFAPTLRVGSRYRCAT